MNDRLCLRIDKNIGRFILKVLVLFLFCYEISLLNVASLFSSRKIIFVLLMFVCLMSTREMNIILHLMPTRQIKSYALGLVAIALYCLILTLLNQNVSSDAISIFPYLIFSFLYIPITSILLAIQFKSVQEFCNAFICSTLIASILVFAQRFSGEVRTFFHNTFFEDPNVSFWSQDRAAIPGASGASLTVMLFLGMLCVFYIIANSKKKKMDIKYFVCYIVFLAASFLAGVTGTVAGGILLIILLATLMHQKRIGNIFTYVCLGLIGVVVVVKMFQKNINSAELAWNLKGIVSLLTPGEENASIQHLMQMAIPPISSETIVGTGIIYGKVGSVSMYHDSGYIKAYVGMGLLVSILYYSMMATKMWKAIKTVPDQWLRRSLSILYICIFIFEYKEPFSFRGFIPVLLLFTFSLLANKEKYMDKQRIERKLQ